MKLFYLFRLNFRKLTKYKSKALFLILPVTVLMTLGIIISSQADNFLTAAKESIFGTVENQNTLLKLTKEFGMPGGRSSGSVQLGGSFDSTQYSESDLTKINNIEYVDDVSLVSTIPLENVNVSDLFTDKSFEIYTISGLNSNVAGLYTTEDFSYEEGEPIPIVINANTFIEQYEDWDGMTEIINDFEDLRGTGGGNAQRVEINTPIKTKAISYDTSSLIGKEFTISFGGFDDVSSYTQEATQSGIKFTKLTDEEIAESEAQQKAAISKYWDYDEISKPITYKFKVVGVIESEGDFSTYIPQEFANKLMKEYIQHQLDARNTSTIPVSELNNTYQGITFDGVEFSNTFQFGGGGGAIRIGRPGESSQNESYTIPGLVIETERESTTTTGRGFFPGATQATVVGEYTDSSVYENALKSGTTMLVKIDSIFNRTDVVKALNSAGYAYQDTADTDVFAELKSTLSIVTKWLTIIFIAFSSVIVIFTMGKFVSESEKEIGIFRALGATKNDMRMMFMVQAILYTAIGYIIGSALGIGLMYILSKPMQLWFDSFVGKTIKDAFNVVNPVDSSIFTRIDWQTFGLFTLLMFVIAIVVSLIPASKASSVSPVRAIRGE